MLPVDHDTITSLATLDIHAAAARWMVDLPPVTGVFFAAALTMAWVSTLWLTYKGIPIPADRERAHRASMPRHTT